jgi:hypothetical protein
MDPSLRQTIIDAFSDTQQWTQQFIVEDSGKSLNLSSVTNNISSRTPDNAQN